MSLTEPERTELCAALEAALAVAAPARSADHALLFQCFVLRDSPDKALPELRALRTTIDRTPALEIFDHAEQSGLWPRMSITRHFLVGWMLSRAQQVGSEQTIVDVQRYLESETLTLEESLHIDGFELAAAMNVGEFRLDRWGDWPMTDTKWQIAVRGLYGHRPSALISRRHEVPRRHRRPWDARPPVTPPSIEPLRDSLRCLTFVTSAAWRLRHHTVLAPEWAPWEPDMTTFGADLSSLPHHVEVSAEHADRINACATRFAALDEHARERLRIPADRLNASLCSGINGVEAAIDLGIALESLYGPFSDNASIGRQLRARVSKTLGGSAKERKALGSIVHRAYDLRSRAVHTGRFDADEEGRMTWSDHGAVLTAVQAGQSVVARSLERFTSIGVPRWDDEPPASIDDPPKLDADLNG